MMLNTTQLKRLETLVAHAVEAHRRAVSKTERLLRDGAPERRREKALIEEERTWALHQYAEALLAAAGLHGFDGYGASWTLRALAQAAGHRADVIGWSRALRALA
jgi:hypothetical protein